MTDPSFTEAYRVQVAQGKAYEELGPLSLEELQLLVDKGMLHSQSLYFDDKEHSWKRIQQHGPLFSKLFLKAQTADDTYEVLFPKADKPALKEAKAFRETELKDLYQKGILTPNSIVFDKEHKSWGPLRVYKKLYHKLNPGIVLGSLSMPAASKTLALRLAETHESPMAATAAPSGEFSSSGNISTAALHTTPAVPRVNDRVVQLGNLVNLSTKDRQGPRAGSIQASSNAPVKLPQELLPQGLSSKPLSPPPFNAGQQAFNTGQQALPPQALGGSMVEDIIQCLVPYARWLMGFGCLLLSFLVYHYHKEDWSAFWKAFSLDRALSLCIQYPFLSLLLLHTVLGVRVLDVFQGLARVWRLLLGVALGGGLGYAIGLVQEASSQRSLWSATVFALVGVLASLSPGRFSFGLLRVSTLMILGYLGFVYKVLGYMAPLALLIIGSMGLYLGVYAYPIYKGRAKHILCLVFGVLILGHLCILQCLF